MIPEKSSKRPLRTRPERKRFTNALSDTEERQEKNPTASPILIGADVNDVNPFHTLVDESKHAILPSGAFFLARQGYKERRVARPPHSKVIIRMNG